MLKYLFMTVELTVSPFDSFRFYFLYEALFIGTYTFMTTISFWSIYTFYHYEIALYLEQYILPQNLFYLYLSIYQ